MKLSLDEAIQRGLKNNLSVLRARVLGPTVRAERIRALSALLPTVNGNAGENVQKNNLATFGFRFPGRSRRSSVRSDYSDIRAQPNMNLIDRWRARTAGRGAKSEGRRTQRAGRARSGGARPWRIRT